MWEDKKTAPGRPALQEYLRQTRAMGEAVEDPESLFQAFQVMEETERAIGAGIVRLISEGYSWADLGRPFGLSRQAARMRWSKWLPETMDCGCPTWEVIHAGHPEGCSQATG